MPLIEVGKKPPLLGQDRPILVYSAYLGSIGMLVAAALKVDLTSYVDTLFPFNIWGYNHFTNNIGRFIGYAFGFTFLFVNFMSYVVVYNLL